MFAYTTQPVPLAKRIILQHQVWFHNQCIVRVTIASFVRTGATIILQTCKCNLILAQIVFLLHQGLHEVFHELR